MPLRDDHEAAIARADALQAELDRERARDREQDAEVARLEAELTAARERLARAEEALAKLRPRRAPEPPPRRAPEPPPHRATAVAAADREPPPKELGLPRPAMVAVGGVFVICILLASIALTSRRKRHEEAPPAPPAGPFVADQLIPEGMKMIAESERFAELHVDYVGSDGVLDPMHGRISILTQRPPPPKPADDPKRPTGAPVDHSGEVMNMIGFCYAPWWSRDGGWRTGQGSCVWFGEPRGVPRCTVAQVLARARADDAPAGLATIVAQWRDDAWQWQLGIHDDVRNVNFEHSYADECR